MLSKPCLRARLLLRSSRKFHFTLSQRLTPRTHLRLFSSQKDRHVEELANLLDDSDPIDPELVATEAGELGLDDFDSSDPMAQSIKRVVDDSEESISGGAIHSQMEDSFAGGHNYNPHTGGMAVAPPTEGPSADDIQRHERQVNTWNNVEATLAGIWKSLDSVDKLTIRRIDKTFKKLGAVETLHVKSVQHSLHQLALLRSEMSQVNSRIQAVLKRVKECEDLCASEWLEWVVSKDEIPFDGGEYLRSPGYELGSMVWCIELRWEFDPEATAKPSADGSDDDDDEAEMDGLPEIIDLRPTDEVALENTLADGLQDSDSEYESDLDEHSSAKKTKTEKKTAEEKKPLSREQRRHALGFTRLGVYVSPRNVANIQNLSSLKAKCDIRLNELDKGDSLVRVESRDDSFSQSGAESRLHLSINGDFFRDSKLVSWGRTIPDGDSVFYGSNEPTILGSAKTPDDNLCVSVKLRVISQTLAYLSTLDSGPTATGRVVNAPAAGFGEDSRSTASMNLSEKRTTAEREYEFVDADTVEFDDATDFTEVTTEEDLESLEPSFESKEAMDEGIDADEAEAAALEAEMTINADKLRQKQLSDLMSVPLEEFWQLFHNEIPAGNVRYGVSVAKLSTHCHSDFDTMNDFRRGPVKRRLDSISKKLGSASEMAAESSTFDALHADSEEIRSVKDAISETDKYLIESMVSTSAPTNAAGRKLNSKQRLRKLKFQQTKLEKMQKCWEALVEKDRNYPNWRKHMAVFLINFRQKKAQLEAKRAKPY